MSATTGLADREPLPNYLAPVPKTIEDLGLRFAWLVVAINLAGTVFGFWYYSGQFAATPAAMWPWVPDSPMATLLIALAIAAWKLGHELPWLTALAFFGNIILGLWTPYTLLVFYETYAAQTHPLMFQFLFWSHLAMVVQAFVLHRITDFPVWGVAVATVWYASNLIVDYFIPVLETPRRPSHDDSRRPGCIYVPRRGRTRRRRCRRGDVYPPRALSRTRNGRQKVSGRTRTVLRGPVSGRSVLALVIERERQVGIERASGSRPLERPCIGIVRDDAGVNQQPTVVVVELESQFLEEGLCRRLARPFVVASSSITVSTETAKPTVWDR